MRKFLGKFEEESQFDNVPQTWIMFRYAEILLNFAEAQNEYAGPSEEIYDAIKALRKRAGIEPGANGYYGLKIGMNQNEMREVIRNERRLELAFEEHRYYDIRRWKIAHLIFNNDHAIRGLEITLRWGELVYDEITLPTVPFQMHQYLYPFSYSECAKNGNLIQNPGW